MNCFVFEKWTFDRSFTVSYFFL